MAVSKIEEYRQKDGSDILKVYLKPTKNFPEGKNYFYCDNIKICQQLLKDYSWYLYSLSNSVIYVVAGTKINNKRTTIRFHQEFALKFLGYNLDCIDHISGVGIDNLNNNLNSVTDQYNQRNRHTTGYRLRPNRENKFQVLINIDKKQYAKGSYFNEFEAITVVNQLRKQYYSDYDYNFLLDRRNDLDILDLERTGIISQDEATYYHVLKYADNAWYYYRYGLEDYFRQHHILVPSYSLDEQGFMIHPVTGQKLCPFK